MSLKTETQIELVRELMDLHIEVHHCDMKITKAYNQGRDSDALEIESEKEILLETIRILDHTVKRIERHFAQRPLQTDPTAG